MSKKTVALIFGGRSPEHEISLLSARNVNEAIDTQLYDVILVGISQNGTWYKFADKNIFNECKKLTEEVAQQKGEPVALICQNGAPQLVSLKNSQKWPVQVAFPVLHGSFGEDGCIQGLFKMANVPFVGCGVWASAAGMDKEVMKRILRDANIPNAKFMLITPWEQPSFEVLTQNLGLPFFIKPASQGSSVGVHKIKSKQDFAAQLADALRYDDKVLAEEFIEGREIECSVMGHNHQPKASVAGEVIPTHEFYSYEAKYLDENGAHIKIPTELTAEQMNQVQTLAKKTYTAMGCEGFTRVDFFLRKKDGQFYVNEINTIPGFTKISMYPKMWEASGLSYRDLTSQLLSLALAKFEADNKLQRSYAP